MSRKTATKWAARYRAEGPVGMADRSSRPHRQPNRTPAPVVRKIVHLRWKQRLGPGQIADRLGLLASTVHAALVRCRLNRLDRLTHRTLAEGWAFKKFYNSESARLAALPAWVHEYNHHRPDSAIGKGSPITRLDNLAGRHN